MARRNVIVELKHRPPLQEAAAGARAGVFMAMPGDVAAPAGVTLDASFGVVELPQISAGEAREVAMTLGFDEGAETTSTYLVRGEIDDDAVSMADLEAQNSQGEVVGIFSDPVIAPCLTCGGSPPVGTDVDVERLLCVPKLRAKQMRGRGVMVAIVDTGINVAYLVSRGKNPSFDAARSWVPQPGLIPGQLPVNHGTMCAYDALIAAPECTLLDIALLQSTAPGSTVMAGLLSDAVRAYAHLITVVSGPTRPAGLRGLVVNNSWGMFHPSWDFPVGNPGNYSDNMNHPFNRIVGTLERAGADILFAAGNCGPQCPDGRCQGVTNAGIYGANSHPQVLSVAGVDTNKVRVGYSTRGPGRLFRVKPDLACYTHFRGSGVYAADGGTSAATPVLAGLAAAVRSRFPQVPGLVATSPAALRFVLIKTAHDLGTPGFDFDHGWGLADGCKLASLPTLSLAVEGDDEAPAFAAAATATSAQDFSTFQPLGPSPVLQPVQEGEPVPVRLSRDQKYQE